MVTEDTATLPHRVVAFVRDPLDRLRLTAALRGSGTLWSCDSADAVLAALQGEQATIAIITTYEGRHAEALALAHRIQRRFPLVAILVYYDPRVTASRQLIEFVDAGIVDIVQRDLDDHPRLFGHILRNVTRKVAARRLKAAVLPRVPAGAQPLLDYLLEHADGPLRVDEVAAALGISRRTLYRRLEALAYPPAEAMIGWCRLLVAAHLLEDQRRSFDSVAGSLRFPSGMALRSLFRRYVGVTGGVARAGDGPLALVLSHFTQLLTGPPAPPG
jgi:AraC-like DNA-binding protein